MLSTPLFKNPMKPTNNIYIYKSKCCWSDIFLTICDFLKGGSKWEFPKMAVPNNHWFSYKKCSFLGGDWRYHHLRKHPNQTQPSWMTLQMEIHLPFRLTSPGRTKRTKTRHLMGSTPRGPKSSQFVHPFLVLIDIEKTIG